MASTRKISIVSTNLIGSGSTSTGSGGSSAPSAPAITADWITGPITPVYRPYGHLWVVDHFEGSFTPPTGTDTSHLNAITITSINPDGGQTHTKLYGPFDVGTAYDFAVGTNNDLLTTTVDYDIRFVSENEDGKESDPYDATVQVKAPGLASVVGNEVPGARFKDKVGALHTVIRVTPTITDAQLPLTLTVWRCEDGVNQIWSGWYALTDTGYFDMGADGNDIYAPSGSDDEEWTVTIAKGAIDKGAPIPDSAITSPEFLVKKIALPASDLILDLIIEPPDPSEDPRWPYNSITKDGIQLWDIKSVSYDDSRCLTVPEVRFVRITAQDLDKDKHPITPEQAYSGNDVIGGIFTDDIYEGYGPRAFAGYSTLNIAYVRFRVYCINRIDETTASFLNPLASTAQTQIGGGLGYVDVLVAQDGEIPPPGIPATRFDPTTVGDGLHVTDGQLQVKTGPGMDLNSSGEVVPKLAIQLQVLDDAISLVNGAITTTYIAASAVTAANMAANSVTAANSAIAANAVVDSNIDSMNISKLIAGTVIFTGDVYMSKGSAKPVMSMTNTGMFLYGVANGPGTDGLTSQPYVGIQSTGIGVFASSTGRSITVTGSALTLWHVNASTTDPYVELTSAGTRIVAGGFTTTISASQISNSFTGGGSMTLNTGSLTLTNGTYSTTVGSTQIQMSNGAGSTFTLNSSGIVLQNGSYSLTASATAGLTLAYSGGSSVQVTSSSITLSSPSGGSFALGSQAIFTYGGLSTTIQGNQLSSGTVTAAQMYVTPGDLTISQGHLRIGQLGFGGTIVWQTNNITSSASNGYITPPDIQEFVTVYVNNGSSSQQFKLALYLP